MAVLPIAQIGEPVLRVPAREVPEDELATPECQAFIDDLIETMRHANGAGLAAPQVFDGRRICALEVDNNPRYPYKPRIPLTVLVNPVLTPLSDETFENFEGCLSVPNLRGRVNRFVSLHVEALDRHGNPLSFDVHGVSAGTYQHEVDHLDATIFVDRVFDTKTLCTWDAFNAHHKDAFVKEILERFGPPE